MTTENISLFQAMSAKMRYLDTRQKVLSENIANADTPGYRPQDMQPADFGALMENVTRPNPALRVGRTNGMHMNPGGDVSPEFRKQKKAYETAPAGNSVVIEEQMVKANETNMNYSLVSSLYSKNVNMIRTALGRSN